MGVNNVNHKTVFTASCVLFADMTNESRHLVYDCFHFVCSLGSFNVFIQLLVCFILYAKYR